MFDKKILTGVITSILASLCCITPVLAVLAGSTGMASTFSWMEPFRPYLIGLTILVLSYAWWDKLKPIKEDIECACDPDENGKVSFWYSTTFLVIITFFSAVMLSFPYWGDTFISSNKEAISIEKQNLQKIEVHIEGMTCKACEATIEKVVLETGAIGSVKASSDKKNVIIYFDKSKIDVDKIVKSIATTGYKPISFEDQNGLHKINNINMTKHKIESSKCGGGKCGAGKCGSGKCGSK